MAERLKEFVNASFTEADLDENGEAFLLFMTDSTTQAVIRSVEVEDTNAPDNFRLKVNGVTALVGAVSANGAEVVDKNSTVRFYLHPSPASSVEYPAVYTTTTSGVVKIGLGEGSPLLPVKFGATFTPAAASTVIPSIGVTAHGVIKDKDLVYAIEFDRHGTTALRVSDVRNAQYADSFTDIDTSSNSPFAYDPYDNTLWQPPTVNTGYQLRHVPVGSSNLYYDGRDSSELNVGSYIRVAAAGEYVFSFGSSYSRVWAYHKTSVSNPRYQDISSHSSSSSALGASFDEFTGTYYILVSTSGSMKLYNWGKYPSTNSATLVSTNLPAPNTYSPYIQGIPGGFIYRTSSDTLVFVDYTGAKVQESNVLNFSEAETYPVVTYIDSSYGGVDPALLDIKLKTRITGIEITGV